MLWFVAVEARFTTWYLYREDGRLLPDPDYSSHIGYRWGCEGLKKTIWKLLNAPDGEQNSGSSNQIEEDLKSSNSHRISYLIKDPSKARKVDDLRQKLRMRGLCCHPMYCRSSTRMQIVLFLASRYRLSDTVSVFNLGIVFHFSLHIPMPFDCIPCFA